MLSAFWREYAHMQNLVEIGIARDEQLDSLLDRIPNCDEHFDLSNTRRQLKNLRRNLNRKDQSRKNLLKQNVYRIASQICESPALLAVRNETINLVQNVAGEDWALLKETLDGNYANLSAKRRIPAGTLKSKVSRARVKFGNNFKRLFEYHHEHYEFKREKLV